MASVSANTVKCSRCNRSGHSAADPPIYCFVAAEQSQKRADREAKQAEFQEKKARWEAQQAEREAKQVEFEQKKGEWKEWQAKWQARAEHEYLQSPLPSLFAWETNSDVSEATASTAPSSASFTSEVVKCLAAKDLKPEECTEGIQEESLRGIVSTQDSKPEEATDADGEETSYVIIPAQDLKLAWTTKANEIESVCADVPTKDSKAEQATEANEDHSPCNIVSAGWKVEEPTEVLCSTGIKEHDADSLAEEIVDKTKKRDTVVPALCMSPPPTNDTDVSVISGFVSKLHPRGVRGIGVDVAPVDSQPQVTPRRRVLAALGKRGSEATRTVDPALESFAERLARFGKK